MTSIVSADEIRLARRIEDDHCFRCGYDLRGMSDNTPCPECGLLAGRSRMPSEELKHARPRWLGKLSAGVWLIILAQMLAISWLLTAPVLISFVADLYRNSSSL